MKMKLFPKFASLMLASAFIFNTTPITTSALSDNPFEREDFLRLKILESASKKGNEVFAKAPEYLGKTERYIAVFKENASLKQIKKALEGYSYRLLADSDERIFLVHLPTSEEFETKNRDILQSLEKDALKEQSSYYPNDTYSTAYEIKLLEMNEAWGYTLGDESVIVAIVDSGIDRHHEDFSQTNILPGYDYESGQSFVDADSSGHGTKIAGIISATSDNGIGLSGIAPKCSILPLKITNSEGKIYTSDFIDSLYLAVDSGADVVNMSLGGYDKLESEEKAVKYAVDKGCILVAAAGNEGNHKDFSGMKCYPASYDGVISVGATDENGKSCVFSQHNDSVDISAPGSALTLLQAGGGYTTDSGTSFSTAYISGLAALTLSILDEGYTITSDQFDYLISHTAKGEESDRMGKGLLSPKDALKKANYPLLSGVEENEIYYDNVRIHFNRGKGLLDGDEFSSGELCKHTGEHTLTITDGNKKTEISFITDNLPLSYSLKEGNGYSYLTFPFGTATLNGHPYSSGDKITSDGNHRLILTGLYGNTESFDFSLSFASPKINGVKDGETYSHPLGISVATGGKVYLDGKEAKKEFTVWEEGQHTLLIKQNGNLKTTVSFTISYENEGNPYKYAVTETSLSDSKSTSGSGFVAVWNKTTRGVRLYKEDTLKLVRYINVNENVTNVYFGKDYLYISGTNHIFSIKNTDVEKNVSLSKIYKFKFPVSASDFNGNALYFAESSSIVSGTVKKIDLTDLTEKDICFIRSIPDVISYDENTDSVAFCKREDGEIYVSLVSGESVSKFKPFEDMKNAEKGFVFRNGKIVSGGKVFSVSENKTVFFVNDDSALYFDGKRLITEKGVYDTETGEIEGFHGFTLKSVDYSNGVYSVCFDKTSLYISKSLPTATVTPPTAVSGEGFGHTENFSLSKEYLHTALCGGVIYASSTDNAIYLLDEKTLQYINCIYLPFVPTGIKSTDNKVFAYSKEVNVLAVYNTQTLTLAYFDTPSGVSHLAVCGKYIAFVSNGELHLTDGTGSPIQFDGEGEYISTAFSTDGNTLFATHFKSFYTVLTAYNLTDLSVKYERTLDYEVGEIFCDSEYLYINTAAYYTKNGGVAAWCDYTIYGNTSSFFVTESGLYTGVEYISEYNAKGNAFILKKSNELLVFDKNGAKRFLNPYPSNLDILPTVSGIQNGKTYSGTVNVSFTKGIGYLDGKEIKSGFSLSDGGTHTLSIFLPFGMSQTYTFSIKASLTSLRIKGGDTAMKVNDTKTFTAEFLPSGSPKESVMFYTDDNCISVTTQGVVTALSQGEATLYAATLDGRLYTSIKISVLSSMLDFTPSYLGVDRENGILYGIPSGTTVDTLISWLDSSLRKDALVSLNGEKAEGIVKTGMKIALLSKSNKELDSLLISVTGDCNGDGNVDIGDLATACQLMGDENAKAVFVKSADFSNTGTIDVADTFTYKEIVLGNEKIVENANTEKPLFENNITLEHLYKDDGTLTVRILIKGVNLRGVSGSILYDKEKLTYISSERIGYINGVEDFGDEISFLCAYRGNVSNTQEGEEVLELMFLPNFKESCQLTLTDLVIFMDKTYSAEDITKTVPVFETNELLSLTTSAGTLIPEFSPEVHSYVLRLPNDVSSVSFSHQGKGELSVIANDEIKDGDTIRLYFEDSEYILTVIKDSAPNVKKDSFPVWAIVLLSVSVATVIFLLFFGKNIKEKLFSVVKKEDLPTDNKG